MSNAHVSSGSGYGAKVSTGGAARANQGTPITVRNFGEPYTGPTTVTPSGSDQTLATEEKFLLSDITVEAIPDDFVGSAVPRNDSSDLTASGDTVTAPAGYYAANASKAVDAAAWKAGSILQPTMTTTVDAAGLVTAKASGTMSVWPIQTSGWALSTRAYPIIFNETDTLQLPTQDADTITPSSSSQTAVAAGRFTTGAVTVAAIPTETASVTPSTSAQTIYPSSDHYIDEVDVAAIQTEVASVTPSTSAQTITPTAGHFFDEVDVAAFPTGSKGGSGTRTITVSTESTKKNYTIAWPDATGGYYPDTTFKPSETLSLTKQSATITPNNTTQTVSPSGPLYYIDSVTVNPVPTESASVTPTTSAQTITPTAGYYIDSVSVSAIQTETGSATPTTSAQTVTPSAGHFLTSVSVDAIPSQYIVPTGTKTITAEGTNIDVAAYATADVAITPVYTATIMEGRTDHTSCISYNNHSYFSTGSTFKFHAGDTIQCINGNDHGTVDVYYNGTKVGDYSPGWAQIYVFTLPANDIGIRATNNDTKIDDMLPTVVTPLSVTANDTYTAPTGMAYSPITVSVSGTTPNLQAKTNIDPTTSSQTITADGGYDGLASVQVNAMPTMTLPSASSSTSSGTSKATITPSSSAQYLNIPTGYNGTAQYYTIAASGSSKNAQVVQGTTRTNSSTMTAIGAVLTVAKTGTYDIYYSAFRTATSTGYTWATQLYIEGVAYGSENTTWTNNQQNTHLTNISLTVGQKLRVYGRETRGTGYYVCAPTLEIVEA